MKYFLGQKVKLLPNDYLWGWDSNKHPNGISGTIICTEDPHRIRIKTEHGFQQTFDVYIHSNLVVPKRAYQTPLYRKLNGLDQ